MRVRRAIAAANPWGALVLGLLVVGAGGAVALGVVEFPGGGDQLEERWLSDTGVPVTGNHHGVAAGSHDGRGVVFVPISGEARSDHCRMVALDAADGTPRWQHAVPSSACMIHAVGTVSLVDFDADGTVEVVVPTAEERLYAFDPAGGEPELVYDLEEYGYSRAVVGGVGEDGDHRIVLVDARGTVAVVRPDGSTDWSHRVDSYVWANPAIADIAGDGEDELVVGFGDGFVTAFERGGDVAWNRSLPGTGSVTWLTVGDADDDGTADVFVATDDGEVHRLDGPDGVVSWTREFADLAAVEAVGDGDGDGSLEVYVTASDGVLRALDAETGGTEWETTLDDEPVQMTPPPVMGDLDGDGAAELVGTTSNGRVAVVDPADGRVTATYERSVPIWTRPTLADTDGDGAAEIYVVYGDGRVAALAYAPP